MRTRKRRERDGKNLFRVLRLCHDLSLQQLFDRHLHSPATYHMHETVDAHLNIMPVRSFSLNLCNLFCICLSLCWSLSLPLLYLSVTVWWRVRCI